MPDLTPEPMARPGRFGDFGGRYVPEALIPALEELDEARRKAMVDPEFLGELERLHRTYTGRPSIITEVPRFAAHAGEAPIDVPITVGFTAAAVIAALVAGRLGAGLDTARLKRWFAWLVFAVAVLVLGQVVVSLVR